ncbi:hypothetical protein N7455_003767 [Penicillium solitum]|uniref:uncharacterized protein n=1 Tax=Penicillium solitum TaxID=60172 RepID=UPI0017E82153|nr:hypothetical protein HAV15_000147 [Penicillium sp. str. \
MTGSGASLAAILARADENDWGETHVTNDLDVAARVPRGPKNKEVCRSSSTSPTSTTSPNSLCDQNTMAERKVLSKYYPPDFDPSAIEKKKRSRKDGKPEPKLVPVRLMTPFAMKCTHCGEYIPKSRKFNGRKETLDEKYIGIVIHRFYIRCSRCSGEITFRTDPKNTDYECERGATRNFEVWRDAAADKYNDETEQQTLDRLEKEHGAVEEQLERDKMAELEDKMLDSKREMQIADALDEIRTRNARIERTEARGDETAMAIVQEKIDEEAIRSAKAEEEDREAIRQEFFQKKRAAEDAARVAQIEVKFSEEAVAARTAFWAEGREMARRRAERTRARKAKGLIKPKPKATASTSATPSANDTNSANATTSEE